MRIHRCECIDNEICVEFSDQTTAQFGLFWLRDHSTDSASLNPRTLQRDYDTFARHGIPQIRDQRLLNDGSRLQIHWLTDGVISEFDAEFLHNMAATPVVEPSYQLWASEFADVIPDFDFRQIVGNSENLLAVLVAIETCGIVTFSHVPTDVAGTRALLEQVGYVRNTVFGDVWEFSNDDAHADSAYTNVGIGLHTDGTYSLDPPGLQLLHCLSFDGEGGFNQFVDGFNIAQTIKDEDPVAYETLTTVKVPAHYIDTGIQLRAEHQVVAEDSQGCFRQVCFNNFDRSPLRLSRSRQASFYHAYGLFQKLANDPAFRVSLQLHSGRAVWFDNWRTLHARAEFSGVRQMAGGYNNREDFVSKLLTLRETTPWRV